MCTEDETHLSRVVYWETSVYFLQGSVEDEDFSDPSGFTPEDQEYIRESYDQALALAHARAGADSLSNEDYIGTDDGSETDEYSE